MKNTLLLVKEDGSNEARVDPGSAAEAHFRAEGYAEPVVEEGSEPPSRRGRKPKGAE